VRDKAIDHVNDMLAAGHPLVRVKKRLRECPVARMAMKSQTSVNPVVILRFSFVRNLHRRERQVEDAYDIWASLVSESSKLFYL
jgi:hypothetical protein